MTDARVAQTPVRLTVPVSFSLRLPDVRASRGFPELRAGGTPTYPSDGKGRRAPASVSITITPSGEILEMSEAEGEKPFAEALLRVLGRGASSGIDGEETATFRLEAEFRTSRRRDRGGHVGLRLTGLQRELPVTAAGRVARAAEAAGASTSTSDSDASGSAEVGDPAAAIIPVVEAAPPPAAVAEVSSSASPTSSEATTGNPATSARVAPRRRPLGPE